MKTVVQTGLLTMMLVLAGGCDTYRNLQSRAESFNKYERTSLALAKENRHLKARVSELEYELNVLKSKNQFLSLKLEKENTGRTVASIPPVNPGHDLVKYNVYQWSPAQILATAEKEFKQGNYEKSAQFFQTFVKRFPNHKKLDDQVLFQTGLAAYESGNHDNWVLSNLDKLVKDYPTSRYYRGAKLWMALTKLKKGDHDSFFQTVEEFRKKYRNTSEWKILSAHYERILQKYKR